MSDPKAAKYVVDLINLIVWEWRERETEREREREKGGGGDVSFRNTSQMSNELIEIA